MSTNPMDEFSIVELEDRLEFSEVCLNNKCEENSQCNGTVTEPAATVEPA